MQPEIPKNQRHHRFFVTEEFITLKVDEVYFNLPTFILKKHSKKLEKLIINQTETDPEYFAPLVQGISVVDLERFLAVLFPTEYGQYEATSFDEWASILKVAHDWEFESIVKLALEKIEPVSSPVDKVVLGKAYDIPEWAIEARILLCRREEPITLEEASRMGMEDVVNISQARHHIRSSEIRPEMQDSTIRSFLSVERHGEKSETAAEVTSQGTQSSSTTAVAESPAESEPVHKDPRIDRTFELRKQIKSLKNRLIELNGRGDGDVAQLDSGLLAEESEDVELQLERVEEEYLQLYEGIHPEKAFNSTNNTFLTIERSSTAESRVLSKLTACLHPDNIRVPLELWIKFPLFDTEHGSRKRPQQIVLGLLERHGIKYTTYKTTGTILVPISNS